MRVLHVNWLDRLLLGKRDPYRPTILLRTVRLQAAFAVSLIIVIGFSGFLWWSAQERVHADCLDRNRRTILSVRVLEQMTAASKADGSANASAVWAQWAKASREAPLPRC